MTQTGTYTITYTATDSSGNTSTSSITIQVIPSGWNSNSGDNKDICPNGDLSGNLYDRLCSAPAQTSPDINTSTSTSNTGAVDTPEEVVVEEEIPFSEEFTEEESEVLEEIIPEDTMPEPATEEWYMTKVVDGKLVWYTIQNTFDTCPIIDTLNDPAYEFTSNIFPDSKDSQYQDIVDIFGNLKIASGNTNGLFEPKREITRAEFTKMVLISHCYSYQDEDTKIRKYKDLKENTWEARVASKAEKLWIINGYEDGTFKADQIITKAEATKILMRMALIQSNNLDTLEYEDVSVEWHKKYIQTGEALWVFDAEADEYTFNPDAGVTREDMVHMIYMVVDLYR